MRKALHFLFPVAALTVALMGSSRAEAPQLAVCREGSCVMAEADYMRLQAFAKRLRDYAQNANEVDEEKEQQVTYWRGRSDSCEAWKNGHKGGWNR